MAKRKLSEGQILNVLKQLEAGRTGGGNGPRDRSQHVHDLFLEIKYGGIEANEAVPLHHLEDENSRPKH